MTKYKDQNGKIYEIDCVDDPETYSEEIINKNYYLLYSASKDFDKEDFAEFLDEDLTDWLTSLPYTYDYAEVILDFLQKCIKGFRYWNVTGYAQGEQAYVWINDEDNNDHYTADELSGLLFGNIYSIWDPEKEDTLEEFWGWEDTQKYIEDNQLRITI